MEKWMEDKKQIKHFLNHFIIRRPHMRSKQELVESDIKMKQIQFKQFCLHRNHISS